MRLLIVLAALLLAPASAQGALVAQYHLDGTVADSSGNGLNGSDPTGDYVSDGRWGQGFNADALREGFDVANNARLEPASALTLAVWVRKPTTAGANRIIVGKLNSGCGGISYGIATNQTQSQPYFAAAGHRVGTTLNVWDGNWHALVGTFDGTTSRFYVDGVQQSTDTKAASTIDYSSSATDRRLQAARHTLPGAPVCNPSDYSITTQLDELRIYDQALTAAQVARISDTTASSPPAADPPPVPSPSPSPAPSRSPAPSPSPAPVATGVNTVLPAISKSTRVNATTTRYSCSTGTWTGLAAPPGFTFAWLLDDGTVKDGRPTAPAEVARGATFDVDRTRSGGRYLCRVTARAANGATVSAASVTLILSGDFTTAVRPVEQRIVGNVAVRGIDVFQTVQPNSGAPQWFPNAGPFTSTCGGGTPTAFSPALGCLLPAGSSQLASYAGVRVDPFKPAFATVYISRAPGSFAAPVSVYLSAQNADGTTFKDVVYASMTPKVSTSPVVTADDRDREDTSVTIPIPPTWLQGQAGGESAVSLFAAVAVTPDDDVEQEQCLVGFDVCAIDDVFLLEGVRIANDHYPLDVRSVALLTENQIKQGLVKDSIHPPEEVLARAVELFPGGEQLRLPPYATVLTIAVNGLTATHGCGSAAAKETPTGRYNRVRACRDAHVYGVLKAYRDQTPQNQRGYDLLMGVHSYKQAPGEKPFGDNLEPGVARGVIGPDTQPGQQPILHVDDGDANRPLTAAAHELGHVLGAPHADLLCEGPSGGAAEAWPPENRGRLQGVRFQRETLDHNVDYENGQKLFDLMSYCGNDSIDGLSAFNWNRFDQRLRALFYDPPNLFGTGRSGQRAAAADTGFVTGFVYATTRSSTRWSRRGREACQSPRIPAPICASGPAERTSGQASRRSTMPLARRCSRRRSRQGPTRSPSPVATRFSTNASSRRPRWSGSSRPAAAPGSAVR